MSTPIALWSITGNGASRTALFTAAFVSLAACTAKPDAAHTDTTAAMAPAPAAVASPAPLTTVRGTIASVSDTSITVTTATGAQSVHVDAPLKVYARTTSDLAHVMPNAFVGITSVAQPDGSQRATEIHIFPEELRGTGEGSRMMEQAAAGDSGSKMSTGGAPKSRMTNGSVATTGDAKAGGSRMTNGSVASTGDAKAGGSRMTNGSVSQTGGGTKYTVQYAGGTQTIDIPANVTVTIISATDTKLASGAAVIVLAHSGADGKLSASGVMLSGAAK